MSQRVTASQVIQLHITELDAFAAHARGRHRLRLAVRQLSDGSLLTMPAAVLSDGADRPRMVLVAGQHGNEWNGTWILHHLAATLNPDDVHGTLVLVPIANPLAFNEGRRVSVVDSIDLNRTYGDGRPRKPTEHLGALLWEGLFSHADYLIDLHSGGPGEYLPFAATPFGKDLELARALNLPFIHTPGRAKPEFLVSACQQAGVKSVLVELGGGRSLDWQYHEAVTDGLVNAMRVIGLLAGQPQHAPQSHIFAHKDIVSAPAPGFFAPAVKLGQHVRTGDRLGTVTPILAEAATEIISPREGTVLYLRRELLVGEQDSLVHIA